MKPLNDLRSYLLVGGKCSGPAVVTNVCKAICANVMLRLDTGVASTAGIIWTLNRLRLTP